jgi:hypothetical protein
VKALRCCWLVLLMGTALLAGCDRGAAPAVAMAPAASNAKAPAGPPLFVDIAKAVGVDFRHVNGMSGEFEYPENIGSGVALFDYDNDGRLDLLVLQGKPLHDAGKREGKCLARLFHNDGGTGTQLRFTDVTEKSGLCSQGYGMGVAVGDIDNDGCVDVYITHFGSAHQLFRNRCNGTFEDVSAKAGVQGQGAWGSSATFVDFDGDGRLDLYVTNYVKYTLAENKKCFGNSGKRDYCAPSAYPNVPGTLYRNLGGGRFADVSAPSGITKAFGAGLGVMAVDLTGDGWPDLFVANDGNPNQLWVNQKDGTFKDEALLRGAAVNADGAAEAGMGLDIGDFDNNGTEDIFMTHLAREKSTMFVNRGGGQFEDRSVEVGVAVASMPYTGFGTAFIDYDNDGWLDIVAVNGEVKIIEALRSRGDPYPLHQRKQLFHNLRNGKFEESTGRGGPAFELSEVGRGLAVGDIDNDGAPDFVVSNNNGALRIFLNQAAAGADWLGLRLLSGKRDAYGAQVELRRNGGPTLWRRVRADGSYLSANDPRILLGLAGGKDITALVVHWPGGRNESFAVPPLGRYTTLTEGTGNAAKGS